MADGEITRLGADFVDLAAYLRAITEEGYPARIVLQSSCGCRSTTFRLEADDTEGCARRTCSACGVQAFLGDSEELWDEAEPAAVACLCGADVLELGIGFSFSDDEEIRWITIGSRCVKCGLMDSPADWKIDYAPTEHLFEKA
jgi:hypothetical protein